MYVMYVCDIHMYTHNAIIWNHIYYIYIHYTYYIYHIIYII